MRTASTALRALFPTIRGEILAATLSQPDKWWYLSELAKFLRTTPSTLQRDLKALVDGGILRQRRVMYELRQIRIALFQCLQHAAVDFAGTLRRQRAINCKSRKLMAEAHCIGMRRQQAARDTLIDCRSV